MSSISCLVAQFTVMLDKSMLVYFSRPFLFQTKFEPNACDGFLLECFSGRKSIVSNYIQLTYDLVLSFMLHLVCWPSIAPQDMKHKSKVMNCCLSKRNNCG